MTDIDTTAGPMPRTGTPNLNKALSLLQGELPKVTKGKHVKVDGKEGKRGYEFDYAELADVTEAVGKLLAKFGLAFTCSPTVSPADRRMMILDWSLLHESGEERSGEWPLGPVGQAPHSLGSAITYGRRYLLGAVRIGSRYSWMAVPRWAAHVSVSSVANAPSSRKPSAARQPPTSDQPTLACWLRGRAASWSRTCLITCSIQLITPPPSRGGSWPRYASGMRWPRPGRCPSPS